MVSFAKAAIVDPSLSRFTAPVFDPSPCWGCPFAGLLYQSKRTAGILPLFENNFTTIGTKIFHYCLFYLSFLLLLLHFQI